MGEGSPLQG
ncbi:hypothetical protein LINPERPRIM_LOCUS40959 [Linum perenne]